MIFLNWAILFGLAALAIPVIIHLLSRNRLRQTDWAAMQFLLSSLAARRRTLVLEEILLLAVRCSLLAFAVLAMARPFIPSSSAIPAYIVFPSIVAAAVLAAVAAVLWERQHVRKRLLIVLASLLAIAGLAAGVERWVQKKRWGPGAQSADLAVILDASSSMMLEVDGKSNFARAIEETREAVKLCKRGDAVSLLLAGLAPKPVIPVPIPDLGEVRKQLDSPDLRPLGGQMAVLDALSAAAASLSEGRNPVKRILLITDGQSAGWETKSEARWQFVEEIFKAMPTRPQFICRRLPMPRSFCNLAVAEITQSRPVVGPDRPVSFNIRIANTGTQPARPAGVELLVDGAQVRREEILKDIPPGASESLTMPHRFEKPGRHLVCARLAVQDDIEQDNQEHRAVDVLDRLPVLLVDGAPSERFFQGAAAFVRLALRPDRAENVRDAAEPQPRVLIEPKVARASELEKEGSLDQYRAIVLANVPRLGEKAAERLTEYVKKGGGLLIAPGRHAEPAFYNSWRAPSGERIAPAAIADRAMPNEGAGLDIKSFTHPAMRLVSDSAISDISAALVRRYWILSPDPSDPGVRAGAFFKSGEPLLVERRLGSGIMLMLAIALDRRDSNLPSLKCFLPLVHELVYYLAASAGHEGNLKPGEEFAMDFTRGLPGLKVNAEVLASCGRLGKAAPEIITPSSNIVPAAVTLKAGRVIVRHSSTHQPGVYRLRLPPDAVSPADPAAGGAQVEIPFVVAGAGQEGPAAAISEADDAALKNRVGMFVAGSRQDVSSAFLGETPGREIWKYLAAAGLLLAVAETAITRWMAVRRRLNTAQTVSLKSPVEALFEFKAALRKARRRQTPEAAPTS